MTGEEEPGRSQKRRRTKAADLGLRRAEIVDAAMRIFAQGGYQGTAFAAVAVEAGMTLPGLLRYFPRKVDLMIAVLEERDRRDSAFFVEAGKSWQGFLTALRKLVAYNEGRPHIVRAFSILNAESLAPDHPGHSFFRDRSAMLGNYLARLLREGQAAGEIRPDVDVDQVSRQIFAFVDGLQIWWLRAPEVISMSLVFGDFLGRLEKEIAPASRGSA